MNFFYCDESLLHAAQALDDRRLTKMILETAQLLNNGMIYNGAMSDAPYRPTHMNHPSSVWCRSSRSNYQRMVAYFEFLFLEFEYRKGKRHACESHYHTFARFSVDMPDDAWDLPYGTPVPNCTSNYKHLTNIIEAYRLHLRDKWNLEFSKYRLGNWYMPKWSKRNTPEWYKEDYEINTRLSRLCNNSRWKSNELQTKKA